MAKNATKQHCARRKSKNRRKLRKVRIEFRDPRRIVPVTQAPAVDIHIVMLGVKQSRSETAALSRIAGGSDHAKVKLRMARPKFVWRHLEIDSRHLKCVGTAYNRHVRTVTISIVPPGQAI